MAEPPSRPPLELQVVRELRLLLHALVDHSMKLLQGGMALLGALLARRSGWVLTISSS